MSTLESISPSSLRSVTPSSGSAGSSPGSEETSNIDDDADQKKKKRKLVRTCYTNEQIQKLMRIFHDNPYPDSEQMEDIAREFGVADNKIKVCVKKSLVINSFVDYTNMSCIKTAISVQACNLV